MLKHLKFVCATCHLETSSFNQYEFSSYSCVVFTFARCWLLLELLFNSQETEIPCLLTELPGSTEWPTHTCSILLFVIKTLSMDACFISLQSYPYYKNRKLLPKTWKEAQNTHGNLCYKEGNRATPSWLLFVDIAGVYRWRWKRI